MNSELTIGFSKPKNRLFPIGSWLIRLYLGTSYSHVYLKFNSNSLRRNLIYEAVGTGGVRFVGSQMWSNQAEELESFTLNLSASRKKLILIHCVDMAGYKYGWLQNIGILIARLLKLKRNPFKKGKNCSEAIADILALEGYTFNMEHDLVTPRDIYEALKKGK
jgi:hypothetical protein